MFFSLASIALVASLPAAFGAPAQKRATNTVIRSGRTNTCLTLSGPIGDGTTLTTGDCSTATRFDISPGSGSVLVSGTNYALDAGVPQGNFAVAKVWTSYPGSPQQTWFLTDDNRIAVTGGNQCLDQGDNGPQTYQCTTGNSNQVWYVGSGSGGSTPASSSASSSAVSTPTSGAVDPSTTSLPNTAIIWNGNRRCLTYGGPPGRGDAQLRIDYCNLLGAPAYRYRLLSNGLLNLNEDGLTQYCVDAGTNPSNGSRLKLFQCYPGLLQQTWTFSNGHFRLGNNQCLDVDNSSGALQTWECSDSDPQQSFAFVPQTTN